MSQESDERPVSKPEYRCVFQGVRRQQGSGGEAHEGVRRGQAHLHPGAQQVRRPHVGRVFSHLHRSKVRQDQAPRHPPGNENDCWQPHLRIYKMRWKHMLFNSNKTYQSIQSCRCEKIISS